MNKICFPHYDRGEFSSLAKAIKFLGATTYSLSRYALRDIVLYTPRYRDHLRRYGVEDLIERLIEEAPQIKSEPVLLHRLRRWAEESPLGDYDIQCYNIKDKVTILGHTFNGLKDVKQYVEMVYGENKDNLTLGPKVGSKRCEDLHIGCCFENYTSYQSMYYKETRLCQSYIFRTTPISQSDMYGLPCAPHELDFFKDHEGIDMAWLPMLYYPDEGDYMFLVTKREEL